MTKPLRIGIIGGGVNSAIGASHLSAIRMDGKYEIVGSLFSRSEEKNLLSHQKYGIPWSGHSDTLETWLEENTGNFDL
jgi:predicted dehydrogenase